MPIKDISTNINIKGAKVHNLKNIDISIPRDKLIVITGVSGSGKSSLAFDTLYAEGQRRYVESLSSYARQFLGKISKPDVDFISGIPPAIAIEQKVNTRNPRSTVGTSTEVYDYLKLLFARIGKIISPISGNQVKKHNVNNVLNFIIDENSNKKLLILSPIKDTSNLKESLINLSKQGFSRIEINGELTKISDFVESKTINNKIKNISLVIDRIKVSDSEDNKKRYTDSINTAFLKGDGYCKILNPENNISTEFSNKLELDGITFEQPTEHTFSFNNPIGACKLCEGYGKIIGIDADLVIPNKSLSIYEESVACWRGEKMRKWKDELIFSADKFDFPIHKPIKDLSKGQYKLLWTGNKHFLGLNKFFKMLEAENYKIQFRVMLARYKGKTICTECEGSRLKKESSYIKINNTSISKLVQLPIWELNNFLDNLELTNHESEIAKRLLIEIKNRVDYLINVGLGYLTLNRLSSTLSGGESQRVNLATSIGSSLVGSLYILDEPSIGLHSRDTELLIKVLKQLKDLGNTVVIVEHDEEIMLSADEIIDIGPLAGSNGGEIIFNGNKDKLLKSKTSLTAQYLNKTKEIKVPEKIKPWKYSIYLEGVYENNLKYVDIKIPLEIFTVITGVSGSGKSSLVSNVLYPSLKKILGGYAGKTGNFTDISGDINNISNIEFVDQNPIGKSSRSNPVTYLKAYDEIRKLYSEQNTSKINNYKPAHFSFNVDGGRCDECQGEGAIKIEMQFMADVKLVCETCNGKKFKDEILEVEYQGKNIYDILELTINEAIDFFNKSTERTQKKIVKRLQLLQKVGLGYLKMGQSSSTLSGGESQRIKLASFLGKDSDSPTMFIFDEPTTGLHFYDIEKLLIAFNELKDRGHTIVVIEHNLDVIKYADWIIDLGPEGGDKGGNIVFEGIPKDIVLCKESYTGKYLKTKF